MMSVRQGSQRRTTVVDTTFAGRAALGIALFAAATAAGAQAAKGTVTQAGKSATMKHAWLVVGPDRSSNATIRRVILSADDSGAKLAACRTMSCSTNDLRNGMTVDLDVPPRLLDWVVLNDQRVQYSGTEPAASLTSTASDAERVAGLLAIDKSASGGPKLDVEFDAPVVTTYTSS
jgi:hypothetical protein